MFSVLVLLLVLSRTCFSSTCRLYQLRPTILTDPTFITITDLSDPDLLCSWLRTCPNNQYVALEVGSLKGVPLTKVPFRFIDLPDSPVYPIPSQPNVNLTTALEKYTTFTMFASTQSAKIELYGDKNANFPPFRFRLHCMYEKCPRNSKVVPYTTSGATYYSNGWGSLSYATSQTIFAECLTRHICNSYMLPRIRMTCRNMTITGCPQTLSTDPKVTWGKFSNPCPNGAVMSYPQYDSFDLSCSDSQWSAMFLCDRLCPLSAPTNDPNQTRGYLIGNTMSMDQNLPRFQELDITDRDGYLSGTLVQNVAQCVVYLRCETMQGNLLIRWRGQGYGGDSYTVYYNHTQNASKLIGSFTFNSQSTGATLLIAGTAATVVFTSALRENYYVSYSYVGVTLNVSCPEDEMVLGCPEDGTQLPSSFPGGPEYHYNVSYSGDISLTHLCTWKWQCPTETTALVVAYFTGGFSSSSSSSAATTWTVYDLANSSSVVSSLGGSGTVFALTDSIQVKLVSGSNLNSYVGSYTFLFSCVTSQCPTLGPSPHLIRPRNATTYTINTGYLYRKNHTAVSTSNPAGAAIVNGECNYTFTCPNPLHFAAMQFSGYIQQGSAILHDGALNASVLDRFEDVTTSSSGTSHTYRIMGSGNELSLEWKTGKTVDFQNLGTTFTFYCFISRCSNNQTNMVKSNDSVTVNVTSNGMRALSGLGLFMNERCYVRAKCPLSGPHGNTSRFAGVTVTAHPLDGDELRVTQADEGISFKFPTHSYASSDYSQYRYFNPHTIGFMFRQDEISVEYNGSMLSHGCRENSYRACKQSFSAVNVYCFDEPCGDNRSPSQVAETRPRVVNNVAIGTANPPEGPQGTPTFYNEECSWRVECNETEIAAVRVDAVLPGPQSNFSITAGGVTKLFPPNTRRAIIAPGSGPNLTLSTTTVQSNYYSAEVLTSLGTYNFQGGIIVRFQCFPSACNSPSSIFNPPGDDPETYYGPVAVYSIGVPPSDRIGTVVYEGEYCKWKAPSCPTGMYRFLSMSGPSRGAQYVNGNTFRLLRGGKYYLGGATLMDITAHFLPLMENDDLEIVFNPDMSGIVSFRLVSGCFVGRCCNNGTQPAVLDISAPSILTRPQFNHPDRLLPKGVTNEDAAACGGAVVRTSCTWRAVACGKTEPGLLLFPRMSNNITFSVWADNELSRSDASIRYTGNAYANYTWIAGRDSIIFPNGASVAQWCFPCNTSAATPRNMGTVIFAGIDANLKEWFICDLSFRCPREEDFIEVSFVTPGGTRTLPLDNLQNLSWSSLLSLPNQTVPLTESFNVNSKFVSAPQSLSIPVPFSIPRRLMSNSSGITLRLLSIFFPEPIDGYGLPFDVSYKCYPTQCGFQIPVQKPLGAEPSSMVISASLPSQFLVSANEVCTVRHWASQSECNPGCAGTVESIISKVELPLEPDELKFFAATMSAGPPPSGMINSEVPVLTATGTAIVLVKLRPSEEFPLSAVLRSGAIGPELTGIDSNATVNFSFKIFTMTLQPTFSITISKSPVTPSQSYSGTRSSHRSVSLSLDVSGSISQTDDTHTLDNSGTESVTISGGTVSTSITPFHEPYLICDPCELDQAALANLEGFSAPSRRNVTFRLVGTQFELVGVLDETTKHPERFYRAIDVSIDPSSPTARKTSLKHTFHQKTEKLLPWDTFVSRVNLSHFSITFGQDDTYFSRFDEVIRVGIFPFAVHNPHPRRVRPAKILLRKPDRQLMPGSATDGATTTAVAASVLSFSAADGAQAARNTLLLDVVICEFDLEAPPSRTSSPIHLAITDDPARYWAGAMLMNPVLIVGFFLLHLLAADWVRQILKIPMKIAMAKVRFPGFSLIPLLFFAQPSMQACGTVIIRSENQLLRGVAIGVAILWIALTGALGWFGGRKDFGAILPNPKESLRRKGWLRFVLGATNWEDDTLFAATNEGFVDRWGLLFNRYRPGRTWYLFIELILCFALGWSQAVMPEDGQCGDIATALVVIFFLQCLALYVFAPYRSRYDMLNGAIVALLQFVAALVMRISELLPTGGSYAKTGATYIIAILLYNQGMRGLVKGLARAYEKVKGENLEMPEVTAGVASVSSALKSTTSKCGSKKGRSSSSQASKRGASEPKVNTAVSRHSQLRDRPLLNISDSSDEQRGGGDIQQNPLKQRAQALQKNRLDENLWPPARPLVTITSSSDDDLIQDFLRDPVPAAATPVHNSWQQKPSPQREGSASVASTAILSTVPSLLPAPENLHPKRKVLRKKGRRDDRRNAPSADDPWSL